VREPLGHLCILAAEQRPLQKVDFFLVPFEFQFVKNKFLKEHFTFSSAAERIPFLLLL
jgi:hypothetical protein